MAAAAIRNPLRQYLGRCVPSFKENAVKIKITYYAFDKKLNMYFQHYDEVYAHDPKRVCKTGDIVLIKTLPTKLTRLITHEILDVIFPLGDITDPITGKQVIMQQYSEIIDKKNEMYGKLPSTFDYDSAPRRGTLEGKRDFTDKPTYKKYQDDEEHNDPYAV